MKADVEVEEGYVEVVEGGRQAAQSSEEALSVAKFHTCPACLGRGLCQVKDHSKLLTTQYITGNFIIILANFYPSGGKPRLVDSVCFWATCAWRHRVPWQSAGRRLGSYRDCGRGRSMGDLGRSSVCQRQPTSWMPRH